jgi:signal transduction histidine kinase
MTQDPNSTWLTLVMHELRTPLTAASGYLELAHNIARQRQTTPGATAPSSLDHLEVCLRLAAQELDFATTMLADLVVAHAEQATIESIPCNLSEIAREVVEAHRVLIPTRVLDFHAQASELAVLVDPHRMKQVLTNYLVNAFKYTPAERPITVLVEQASPQFVRVVVRDEGPGIPLDAQPHLWEKGYRVPGGTQGREGLGLGLFICRMLIERQGGTVGVDSSPGQGAAFWLMLPVLPTPPEATQEPDPGT